MGSGLITDLYELRMVASYYRRGMTGPATFSLFGRSLPAGWGFLVAGGLSDALDHLEHFSFDAHEVDWLGTQGFGADSLEALSGLRFTGDAWAVPEGTIVFPDEPLLEVTAPLPEAQLVETVLLNQITYQTALATKAARCQLATAGRARLVDFSFRRTHGIEAGLAAARAAIIAGFDGTSNVEAARRLGVTPIGTMAHSFIEAFPDEREAFAAFAEDYPEGTVLLVDTYDSLAGVALAADVARELDMGDRFGVRLDSGDLLQLAFASRQILDRAGCPGATIVASGGLDETEVERLLDAGAPIDVFGVGTKVGVSADAPYLNTAYKLVEYDNRPVMKLSPDKVSRPGPKQVYRTTLDQTDLLTTRGESGPVGPVGLLEPVMAKGRRIGPAAGVAEARDRLAAGLRELPAELARIDAAPPPPVRVSSQLGALTDQVRTELETALAARPEIV